MFHSTGAYLGSDIVDAVPEVTAGFVDIPTGPGLGVKLLPNAASIRPALHLPKSMRPHRGGFVVDQ
jgi:galactonate dehydratase